MAFTLSHCIVAIPLTKIFKQQIPFASIAIGSMTPDLYRLLTTQSGSFSHQWTSLIVPNLFVGLLFCFLWYYIYKPTLSYIFISKYPKTNQSSHFIRFFLLILGLLLGCITHLIWDGLTHLDHRTLLFHSILAQEFIIFNQSYALHFLLQIFSSFIALPVLFYFMYQYFKNYMQLKIKSLRYLKAIIGIFILSTLAGSIYSFCYIFYLTPNILNQNTYYLLGRILNLFTVGFLLASTLFCLILNIYSNRIIFKKFSFLIKSKKSSKFND